MRDRFYWNSETLGRYWCRLMHSDAMWPIRGHYRCRRCHRRYSVPWEERKPVRPGRNGATAGRLDLAPLP